jgi:hypothetical protein
VAWSWFRQIGVIPSHPPAGNAHRWAVYNQRITSKGEYTMDSKVEIVIILVFAILVFWTLRSGKGKATLEILRTKMQFERTNLKAKPKTEATNKLVAGAQSSAKNVSQLISTEQETKAENIATLQEKAKIEDINQEIKGK